MTFEQDWGIGLVQATENLDEMLRVVENGRVTCCIGFEATFFSQGPTEDARNRVVDAYELYVQAIGPDKLLWGEDPKAGALRRVDETGIGDVREWSPRVALRSPYSFLFHGGADKTDASPYMTSALLKELEDPSRLFNFSFSVPLAWVAAHKAGAIVELVVGVCSKLQPEHGYAGLAIIPWVREYYLAPSLGTVAAFVRRFRGLELDFPSLNARLLSRKPAIRGINWLTVLADPWVEKLGGTGGARSQARPGNPRPSLRYWHRHSGRTEAAVR
jgi:hypothetical protein